MVSISSESDQDQIKQAMSCIQLQDFKSAEAIYRQLLDQGTNDAGVYSNLAVLCGMNGRTDERLQLLLKGINADPAYAQAHLNLGVAYQEIGKLQDAISCYREALRLEPELPEGHSNLGFALLLTGEHEAADAALSRALSLKPDYVEALSNLAQHRIAIGDDSSAIEIYRRCLALVPDSVRYYFAMGTAMYRCNQVDDAINAFEQCLVIDPHRSDILIELCTALRKIGRADDAIIRLLPCLAAEPDNVGALLGYAIAVYQIGSVEQAIEILEQALRIQPENVDCLNHIGMFLQNCGRIDDAIIHFEKALLLCPSNASLLGNLATAYRFQGRYDAALKLFHEALTADPNRLDIYHGLLFHYSIGSEVWSQANLEAARTYWKLVREKPMCLRTHPSMGCSVLKQPLFQVDQKTRIGILSAEVGNHCVSMFLAPLLEHFNRTTFEVEIISVSRMYHERALALAGMASYSYSLQGLGLAEARRQVQNRRYDIIIETSGFTMGSGIDILAERCATVQAHYIGYHATTGLDTIDYFIGDDETIPEAFASHFSETLWRLPRTWLACSPLQGYPVARSEATKPIPALGSFNQLSKIREDTLAFWGAAMQKLPTSILIIKDKAINSPYIVERIKAALKCYAIDPRRLFFLSPSPSWEAHLLHYNIIDVALDATPWSSATTAFDALAMGVPLVSIRGECTSARMSTSLLKGLGRDEWIASTPDEYADIVANLCSDLVRLRYNRLARQKEALMSVLFDGKDMATTLESAFVKMLQSTM